MGKSSGILGEKTKTFSLLSPRVFSKITNIVKSRKICPTLASFNFSSRLKQTNEKQSHMSAASFISYKFSKADLRNGVPPTRVLATKTTINKRNNSLSGSTFSYHRISCTSLHRLLLVVFCATLLLTGTRADELEYRLTRYLMANYDPSVRPAHNSSEPLSVVFGLSLHSIIDVDEKNQILTTNCWLTQVWIDAHLIWNASDFGGISVIRVPYDKVWKPDIILYNNADAQYSASTINTNVIVKSNGEVTWLSHGIYRSSCEMNVEYFPFDVQSCKMKWSSWTYDGYQLDLAQQMEEGDMSNYKPNGEFDLDAFTSVRTVAIYSCCPEPYPDITYTILLRRRPMFYVFNLILPCLLINGIALLVFYVPSESGEKVTLGISALLSMTVFLITIRESLPPTEKTPLISLYYGVTICLVTLASALSVLTLNLHHRGLRGVEVPPLARKIILGWGAKFVLLNFKDSEAQAKAKLRSGGSRDTEKFQMHDLDPMEHMERFSHFDPFSVSPHFSPRHRLNHSSNDLIHAHSTGPTSPIMGTSAEMTEFEQQFLRVLRKVQQTIDKNETRLSDQDRREAIKDEWQRVSMVLDRALLLCFVLATSVATSCILLSSPHGP